MLPTSVEAGATADMTWYVPTGEGGVLVNGSDVPIDPSITEAIGHGCTAEVEVAVKAMMEISFGCRA